MSSHMTCDHGIDLSGAPCPICEAKPEHNWKKTNQCLCEHGIDLNQYSCSNCETNSKKSLKVSGKITGNGECWCLEVTEEEYRKIVGEEMYELEKRYRAELEKDEFAKSLHEASGNDRWLISPNDLMNALGFESNQKVAFEIKAL